MYVSYCVELLVAKWLLGFSASKMTFYAWFIDRVTSNKMTPLRNKLIIAKQGLQNNML